MDVFYNVCDTKQRQMSIVKYEKKYEELNRNEVGHSDAVWLERCGRLQNAVETRSGWSHESCRISGCGRSKRGTWRLPDIRICRWEFNCLRLSVACRILARTSVIVLNNIHGA